MASHFVAGCAICDIGFVGSDTACVIRCGHTYHRNCLLRWFQTRRDRNLRENCPTCRANSNTSKIIPLYLHQVQDQATETASGRNQSSGAMEIQNCSISMGNVSFYQQRDQGQGTTETANAGSGVVINNDVVANGNDLNTRSNVSSLIRSSGMVMRNCSVSLSNVSFYQQINRGRRTGTILQARERSLTMGVRPVRMGSIQSVASQNQDDVNINSVDLT